MKLPHVAQCSSGVDDTIEVNQNTGDEVYLTASGSHTGAFSVYLRPEDARRLAKAIKQAAKQAEGADQ